jgi:beta-aspartyl-peptidase (threonine type)
MRLRFALLVGALLMTALQAQAADWALAIHGGAGVIERAKMDPATEASVRADLAKALEAGSAVLRAGGSALDAVEAAVITLEESPHFNAGKGAVFTWDDKHELDASIMDGRTRAAGAVAGVTRTRNPIKLARRVMEQSPHVLLAGRGADQFSRDQGLEPVPNRWFDTPHRKAQWREAVDAITAREKPGQAAALPDALRYGTVGAVARDAKGSVAAATSTGGMTAKRWGRVGDSPLIGAGTYAQDGVCAVSATGWGEYFIRANVAADICARVRYQGTPIQQAADATMADVASLGGDGGVILMPATGAPAFSFNTLGMYRGRVTASTAPRVAIYGDE